MIDEDGNVRCDVCNHYMQIGEHPFCPHKGGASTVFSDEIPGGILVDNYGPHPIRFYSHSARRSYMKEHGLTEREKFSPMPGTDVDPQGIPNPAGYLDPQTLENAKALICRNGTSPEPWDGEKAGVLRNLTTGVMSEEEATHAAK